MVNGKQKEVFLYIFYIFMLRFVSFCYFCGRNNKQKQGEMNKLLLTLLLALAGSILSAQAQLPAVTLKTMQGFSIIFR